MKKTLVFLASIAFAFVMLYSCNNGATSENSESTSPLVKGQWTSNFFGTIVTYQFNDDKTGKFISSEEGKSYDFTYETTEDSIFFTNVSDKSVLGCAYTLLEENKLRITEPCHNRILDREDRK